MMQRTGRTIINASSIPLTRKRGTIPDVSGSLMDWFQLMQFQQVIKQNIGYQVVEDALPTNFWGMIQPLIPRKLYMKPEGQRAWSWYLVHAEPALVLKVDDVIVLNGVMTRVMSRRNNENFGYVEYEMVQDWIGSDPALPSPTNVDGGNAYTVTFVTSIDGGNASGTGPDVLDGGTSVVD